MSEHADQTNRRVHFVGTVGVICFLLASILTQEPWLLIGMPLCGYGFAWFGHFIIEKNRPATFKHPLWSLRGDFKMFYRILTGKMKF
jgi:hypothetical protein